MMAPPHLHHTEDELVPRPAAAALENVAGVPRRCTNPNATGYTLYGGRGIKVCLRWMDFENFIADMGARPSPKHEIDRVDNDGPYAPDNCRWSTRAEQNRNKRTSRWITAGGLTLTLAEWADLACVTPSTILGRLKRGWSPERAVAIPRRH